MYVLKRETHLRRAAFPLCLCTLAHLIFPLVKRLDDCMNARQGSITYTRYIHMILLAICW